MIILNDDIISENINLIELHLFSNKYNNSFDIKVNDNYINKIKEIYNTKFKQTNKYKTYYKNELIYIYDTLNDNQYVISKLIEKSKIYNNNILINSYVESKYPTYLFSCTNDIHHISEYEILECKINNRISINIKKENNKNSIFISYKHSNNLDTEQNQNILNDIIKKISIINI